jgi:hypothetical protein
MARGQSSSLALDLESSELPVVRAAIAIGLEDVARRQSAASDDARRLTVLQTEAAALLGRGPFRLPLDRTSADLLRTYVTVSMAAAGYVVGKPAAITAMTSVHQKLDCLLRGGRLSEMRQAAGEIMYGVFVYDGVRMFRKQESSLEHLFVLISFGDMLGVPILPPYYTLRLLPFVVPLINGWRRRMLREKDLLDALF